MSNVTVLKVAPKKIEELYRRHKYIVRYKPSTKEWEWIVEVKHTSQYKETARSMLMAQKAAKKFIDQIEKRKETG